MENKYYFLNIDEHKKLYSMETGKISPFEAGIPLLDISDDTIQEIYYFRWHNYFRHVKETPVGYVITEFLPPVPWAGKYNTINCPAGHHFYEGRWIHNSKYLTDYAKFWVSKDGDPRRYSFWIANSVMEFCRVKGDYELAKEMYEDLKRIYSEWESDHLMENGLFYQIDDRDGMEYSAGGSGNRPTINSYMYADAVAISKIAKMLGKDEEAKIYENKSMVLKEKINTMLWDADAEFFKTLAEDKNYELADAREEVGFVPWCFNIPDENKSVAWKFLNDENYFWAPYGPTTTERNYPDFMKWFDHECLWNGPSWPFATSQTATAMGNLLCNYSQNIILKSDYFDLIKMYANEHYIEKDGERVPFIDENLDPFTGEWIAKKLLEEMENPPGGIGRGEHYNHSSFCDLVLNGLVGVRTRDDDILEVNPLFEDGNLEYMCADGIMYRGHSICVMWDKTGNRYGKGAGLRIYVDGDEAACKQSPEKTEIKL